MPVLKTGTIHSKYINLGWQINVSDPHYFAAFQTQALKGKCDSLAMIHMP
jgi:hypothetical protein